MKKIFLLLIVAAALAANIFFPGNKLAMLILAAVLFAAALPKLILWAIQMDERRDTVLREKIIQKRAKEKKEREERLDKICREVPQEHLT